MIQLEQKTDVQPTCPHCEEKIEKLWFREIKGVLGKRYLYFCSACTKVLGVSHRKGLLMG